MHARPVVGDVKKKTIYVHSPHIQSTIVVLDVKCSIMPIGWKHNAQAHNITIFLVYKETKKV